MRVNSVTDPPKVLRDREVSNRGFPRRRHRLGRAKGENVSRKACLIKIEAL